MYVFHVVQLFQVLVLCHLQLFQGHMNICSMYCLKAVTSELSPPCLRLCVKSLMKEVKLILLLCTVLSVRSSFFHPLYLFLPSSQTCRFVRCKKKNLKYQGVSTIYRFNLFLSLDFLEFMQLQISTS